MIKFFRNIRRRLLTDRKFSKYLLYAIGEIMLVVIGILIALQVNNWNELQKSKTKESHALKEIISDLAVSIESFEYILSEDINSMEKGIESLNFVISHMESDAPYIDSLGYHFRNIHHYPDLDLKSSGYESLLSMGMDVISNNELRSKIGRYYSFIIPNVEKAYRELRDDFYSYMLGYMRSEFEVDLNDNRIDHLIPHNYQALKRDKYYINSLKTYLSIYEYYNGKVLDALQEAEDLKIYIESNI